MPTRNRPKRFGAIALLAATVLPGPAFGQEPRTDTRTWAFVNGLWFDGQRFIPRTGYAIDGRLTFVRPDRVERTLDLAGGYVVPPFGEAHNHNLITASLADAMIPRYLAEGVFYAKMQSSLPRLTDPIRDRFNRPNSVAVVFANGPLTATGGHPALTGLLRTLLYEVAPADPVVFSVVPALALVTAVVASWLPAWRVSRADPCEVLRAE